MKPLFIMLAGLAASPAFAFELGMPVDCVMGKDCVVQNYVDHDPSTGDKAYKDFTCGPLSYDGHKGTDIRAVNRNVMRGGVNVLAMAEGVVLGMRDGVEDGAPVVKNMECGNGMRISHKDGWITQYCHMKKGSVKVQKGDTVHPGQVLGQIGLTGDTVFPHVHVNVEKDGQIIDPYTGAAMEAACGQETKPLWSAEAAEKLAYNPTGLLGAGFTNKKPDPREFQEGLHQEQRISVNDPILVFWVEMYGVRAGDTAYIALRDPQGMVLAEQRQEINRNRATQNYFVGKANREGMWPEGQYSGILRLTRDGKTVLEREWKIEAGA